MGGAWFLGFLCLYCGRRRGIGCGLYVLILGAGGRTEQEKAERTEYHFCCHNLDELRWMMTTWSRLSRGPKWLVLCTYDAKVSINYLVKIHTRRRHLISPVDTVPIEGKVRTTIPSKCKPLLETIARGHLFTACTFLLRTSQPKASDLRGKNVRVMKKWSCAMAPYIGIWVHG